MSFTGLEYDMCEYRQTLKESAGRGLYYMSTPLKYNVNADNTDVESELFGLPRPAAKCPSKRYIPGRYENSAAKQFPTDVKQFGRDELCSEVTRISNPVSTLRGMGVNWFGHPLEPPQDHAIEPFDRPADEKRNAKDNHRPCIAEPYAADAVFPPPAPEHVEQPEYVFVPVPTIPFVQVAQPPREFRFVL